MTCALPYMAGVHRCRVGGGLATLSDDGGRTWFCRADAPAGFFPAAPEAPKPPAPVESLDDLVVL